jgi:hypothetical protein
MIISLLREHFSDINNLEFGGQNAPGRIQLSAYQWQANENRDEAPESPIQIKASWAYNDVDSQKRPALYVKRNRFVYQRLGINDGLTSGPRKDRRTGEIIKVPGDYHSKAILGSHTIFCVGSSGAEAELLGSEVSNHLSMFGPALRTDLKLHRFEVTEVGDVSHFEESSNRFVVPVVAGYIVMQTWRIDVVAPMLKTLELDLRAANR